MRSRLEQLVGAEERPVSAVRKPGRRWPLIALAAVLAAAVVFFLLRSCGSSGEDWRESFRPVTVESIAYQDSVEISGNLEPLQARDLAFPVSGKVMEVPVQAGDTVAQGALLARLDDQAALYELSLIEGTLEQKRYSAPPRELKNLELERDIKAQAVRDRELRAPFSGPVTAVEVQPGDFTAAGRKVVRMADLSSLKAKVQIDELDAPRVKPGLPVRFYFDALPDLEVDGRRGLPVGGRAHHLRRAGRAGRRGADRAASARTAVGILLHRRDPPGRGAAGPGPAQGGADEGEGRRPSSTCRPARGPRSGR